MPRILELYLDSLDRGFLKFERDKSKGYKALVAEAKKNGVRVIALDSAASNIAGHSSRFGSIKAERFWAFNYFASLVVESEVDLDREKVVYLVGSGHAQHLEYGAPFSSGEGEMASVPGLREIRQAPALLVQTKEERKSEEVNEVEVKKVFEGSLPYPFRTTPDVTLNLPKETGS